jgi:hypothetical protein
MTRMIGTNLRIGEWVEVRSKEEIFATLDKKGCLDGMPFMPEMFGFCGRRFQVHKIAHKTCDTTNPIRSRRLDRTVHLQTRCDGSAHGGCQAECLLFWKEAWLRPVPAQETGAAAAQPIRIVRPPTDRAAATDCAEADVTAATRAPDDTDAADPTYACQATLLPQYGVELNPYDPRQYLQDLRSGNVTFGKWLRGMIYITYNALINLGVGWGPSLRWLYDRFQALIGGTPYPRSAGHIPIGRPTPTGELRLREGEWVRVKSFEEIRKTCNVDNRNRGMGFDAEQVPYCGETYRVRRIVTKILNERTGKMMNMKNPCIILEDVFCRGRYSECRMFCPREIFAYWREIWLDRVSDSQSVPSTDAQQAHPATSNRSRAVG